MRAHSRIDFEHKRNQQTLQGPRAALRILFPDARFGSVLDLGCGQGTWLKALLEMGATDILGVDGVRISEEELLFPREDFHLHDLREPLRLSRRYDMALCLEVAEHLELEHAPVIVKSLTEHADKIWFSAACPNQPGQGHVNRQWPGFWQDLFNQQGFTCVDWPRWALWAVDEIEPWYRQNLFVALKDPDNAGREPRIRAVVHPGLLEPIGSQFRREGAKSMQLKVEAGGMPLRWYVWRGVGAITKKLFRRTACS